MRTLTTPRTCVTERFEGARVRSARSGDFDGGESAPPGERRKPGSGIFLSLLQVCGNHREGGQKSEGALPGVL